MTGAGASRPEPSPLEVLRAAILARDTRIDWDWTTRRQGWKYRGKVFVWPVGGKWRVRVGNHGPYQDCPLLKQALDLAEALG